MTHLKTEVRTSAGILEVQTNTENPNYRKQQLEKHTALGRPVCRCRDRVALKTGLSLQENSKERMRKEKCSCKAVFCTIYFAWGLRGTFVPLLIFWFATCWLGTLKSSQFDCHLHSAPSRGNALGPQKLVQSTNIRVPQRTGRDTYGNSILPLIQMDYIFL